MIAPESRACGKLPMWIENPYSLISPGEILMTQSPYVEDEYVTAPFNNLFYFLACIDEKSWIHGATQLYTVALLVEDCARQIETMGLQVSATHARTLHSMLDKMTSGKKLIGYPALHDQVTLLRQALHIELAQTVFVNVEATKAIYFRKPLTDVSEHVQGNFQSTIYDFTEAAKCYALSRSTACVAHCMRVLEVGLISLGNALNVPEAHTKNWNRLLEQIEKAIKAIGPNSDSDWREQQAFYSKASAQFDTIRIAWRNNVMHAHDKYTELEAREILGATRAIMRQIATRLKESS
ncbi:MAG: hypothetical protein ABSG55_06275 [Dehalococcoidia bacterium]|jgi:hypothetical protein